MNLSIVFPLKMNVSSILLKSAGLMDSCDLNAAIPKPTSLKNIAGFNARRAAGRHQLPLVPYFIACVIHS